MLKMNKDKRPKEQGNLLSRETQPKIEHAHEKDRHENKIYLLFLIEILLFSIAMNTPLKSVDPKTEDNISSFDYINTKIEGLNSERNYLKTNSYQEHNNCLNPLLFLDHSQEIHTNSLLPFKIDNAYYFLSFFGNTLLYKDSSILKLNYNMLNKLLNVNKLEDDNNLEIYKHTKFDFFFKTILNETILNEDVLSLSFNLDN